MVYKICTIRKHTIFTAFPRKLGMGYIINIVFTSLIANLLFFMSWRNHEAGVKVMENDRIYLPIVLSKFIEKNSQ